MPAKPVAIASDPPAPVRSAEPLTSREPEPGAPSSAKSSAPLPRVTPKNKAVASKPDYLSSPAFSQRR
jgi:hypothetical protein